MAFRCITVRSTHGAKLFAAAAVLALAGCATGYQPNNPFMGGGFTETQLDRNMFRVSFRGNGYTSPDRAEDFALLRSAELALKNGFTHFVIVQSNNQVSVSTYTTPVQTTTTGTANAYGGTVFGSSTSTTTGGQTFVNEKPRSTNTIICFNGKPDGFAMVYDAKFVFESLSRKYEIAK